MIYFLCPLKSEHGGLGTLSLCKSYIPLERLDADEHAHSWIADSFNINTYEIFGCIFIII